MHKWQKRIVNACFMQHWIFRFFLCYLRVIISCDILSNILKYEAANRHEILYHLTSSGKILAGLKKEDKAVGDSHDPVEMAHLSRLDWTVNMNTCDGRKHLNWFIYLSFSYLSFNVLSSSCTSSLTTTKRVIRCHVKYFLQGYLFLSEPIPVKSIL